MNQLHRDDALVGRRACKGATAPIAGDIPSISSHSGNSVTRDRTTKHHPGGTSLSSPKLACGRKRQSDYEDEAARAAAAGALLSVSASCGSKTETDPIAASSLCALPAKRKLADEAPSVHVHLPVKKRGRYLDVQEKSKGQAEDPSSSKKIANASTSSQKTAKDKTKESGNEARGASTDDAEHPDSRSNPLLPSELRPAPFFYYRDHSKEEDDDPLTPLTPMARVPNFPAKMHAILAREDLRDVIAWMPHGRSWKILKPREFEIRVLPTYFDHSKFSSFVRQANGWGFRRITQGRDRNSYYNELFLRGLPHLCKRMRRPAVSQKTAVNPDHEPNFYEISKLHPVPDTELENDDSILLKFTVVGGPKARMPVQGGLVPPTPDGATGGWSESGGANADGDRKMPASPPTATADAVAGGPPAYSAPSVLARFQSLPGPPGGGRFQSQTPVSASPQVGAALGAQQPSQRQQQLAGAYLQGALPILNPPAIPVAQAKAATPTTALLQQVNIQGVTAAPPPGFMLVPVAIDDVARLGGATTTSVSTGYHHNSAAPVKTLDQVALDSISRVAATPQGVAAAAAAPEVSEQAMVADLLRRRQDGIEAQAMLQEVARRNEARTALTARVQNLLPNGNFNHQSNATSITAAQLCDALNGARSSGRQQLYPGGGGM